MFSLKVRVVTGITTEYHNKTNPCSLFLQVHFDPQVPNVEREAKV